MLQFFIHSEVNIIKLVIRKLGGYIFHSEVKSSTTHVVIKSQFDRTLPVIFAMAFGCFIISEEWVNIYYLKISKIYYIKTD